MTERDRAELAVEQLGAFVRSANPFDEFTLFKIRRDIDNTLGLLCALDDRDAVESMDYLLEARAMVVDCIDYRRAAN